MPLADWSWAVSKATQTLPTAELGDEDLAGSRHLREVVTAYHRRVRSGCATADDAVVVSGFRQGLTFALAALAEQRHPSHRARRIPVRATMTLIARRAGLEAVPVPVDDDGLDVGRLRETGARAVLLTPAHQCPTGVALGPSRRRELIAWADEVDGVILEDDYDAEFRYDRQPVGSLQGLELRPRDRSRIREQDARSRDPAGLGARAAAVRRPGSSTRSASAVAAHPASTRKRWRC